MTQEQDQKTGGQTCLSPCLDRTRELPFDRSALEAFTDL